MKAVLAIIEGEEELGLQRQCSDCREWWPNDPDFFYSRNGTRRFTYNRCRACYLENSAAIYEKRRAARRARQAQWREVRRASETPEERAARLQHRREVRRAWWALRQAVAA